jgi:delta 1-pyrroline-5-carboxylate dehydrogenase
MDCAKSLFEFRGYKNIKFDGPFLRSDEAVCVYLADANTKKEHKEIIKKTREGQRIVIIYKKAPKRFVFVDGFLIETVSCDKMIVPLGENEVFAPFLRVRRFTQEEVNAYN